MSDYANARNAAWDAVLNWPDLVDVFQRTYKFDGDTAPELAPQPDQLPAIELYPVTAVSKQFLNRQHEEIFSLKFLIYTATWNPASPEDLVTKIRKALWQSKPESGPTYIQQAIGRHPQPNLSITFQRGYLPKNTKTTLTTFQFDLVLKHDPLQ